MKKQYIILNILLILIALSLVFVNPSYCDEKTINEVYYESEAKIVTDDNILEVYAEAIENQKEEILPANKSMAKTYLSVPNALRDKVVSGVQNLENPIKYENYIVENVPLSEDENGNLTMDLSDARNEITEFFDNLFNEFMLNPEIYYMNGWEWGFTASGEVTGENTARAYLTITLTPYYQMTQAEVKSYQEKIDKTVEYYLSGIDDGMTDLVKIIYTNNFIAMRTTYDNDLYNSGYTGFNVSHTMVGPLANGLSVCDGYSNAFKYLLSKVGVEANLVVSTQIDHAWNHVKYNNQYYNVDVTWNDTANSERIQTNYKYFMKSDSAFMTADLGHYATDWEAAEQATNTKFDTANTAWKDYRRYLACYGENVYKIPDMYKFEVWNPENTYASKTVSTGIASYNNAIAYFGRNIYLVGYNGDIYKVNVKDISTGTKFYTLPGTATYLEYIDGEFHYNVSDGKDVVEAVELPEEYDYEYIIKDDEVTITEYTGADTNVTIPSKIEGKNVTCIGTAAFSYNNEIKSVTIPSTVTSINLTAFIGCRALETVNLPNTITKIESQTFKNCISLKNITLPEGLTSIGESAFSDCIVLESINIPDTVTTIGGSAFYDCPKLKSIELPDGITTIELSTFAYCKDLETVKLPSNVTSIGNGAFRGCTALSTVEIPKTVTSMGASVSPFADCSEDFTLLVYRNSYAEQYAKDKSIKYEYIDPIEEITTVQTEEIEDSKGNSITAMILEKATSSAKNDVETIITEENFPILADDNVTVVVKDKNGNVKTGTDKIGTRCVITVYDNDNNVLAEYTITVNGDVDGDGRARIFDSFTILEDTFEDYDYDAIDYMTRDYNQDGKIRIFDAFSYLEDSI